VFQEKKMPGTPIQFQTNLQQFNDRADYEAKKGKQPPPFDPTKPVRKWIAPGVTSLQFLNDTQTAFFTKTFPAGELDEPNLTGASHFPAYVSAPTKAIWAGGMSLPAQYLCSREDADTVGAAIGATVQNGTDYYGKFKITFTLDATDPRQPWMLVMDDGAALFAGPQVAHMYANGIGAPGSWAKGGNGAWTWVSTHVPDGNDGVAYPLLYLPVVPVPPGFELSNDSARTGAAWTALGPPTMIVPIGGVSTGTGSGSGGGLTDAQAASLAHIEAILVRLFGA